MPNNTSPTLPTSILLLLNAITSKLVTITTFLTLIYFHNYFTFHFVVGSILNMMLGKAMKRILNIQRPTQSIKSDPGMPSSHATSLSYFATSFTFTASNPEFQYNSSLIILSSWLYVFTICYTRTTITNVHTVPQIAAGLMLGTTFASIWYYIVLQHSSVESVVFSDYLWKMNEKSLFGEVWWYIYNLKYGNGTRNGTDTQRDRNKQILNGCKRYMTINACFHLFYMTGIILNFVCVSN